MAEVRLLDLEQAGRAGTARYGYFLNDKVAWPLQKPDGQLITQQHDRALLHITLADCQSTRVRQPSTPAQARMRPSMRPSTPRWGDAPRCPSSPPVPACFSLNQVSAWDPLLHLACHSEQH